MSIKIFYIISSLFLSALFLDTNLYAETSTVPEISTVTKTQVTVFQPTLPPGNLVRGSCWTYSIAVPRAGAWRCMVGNSIHDPCFTTHSKGILVCNADPIKHKAGFKLALTEPLPTLPPLPASTSSRAWILQLADDSICSPYTGTMPAIGNTPVEYGCSDSNGCAPDGKCRYMTGILGDLQPGKVWTAKKVTYSIAQDGHLQIEELKTMAVKNVWQ